MRITNNMLIGDMSYGLNQSMNRLQMLQYQNSTGKKFRIPSDDPINATKSLMFRTNRSKVQQYRRNVEDARSWMTESESGIDEINKILHRANQLSVQAANDTNDEEDLIKIREEISELKGSLIKLANSTFGDRYIYSGFDTNESLLDEDGNYNISLNVDEVFNYKTGVAESVDVNTIGSKIYGISGEEYKKAIEKLNGTLNDDPEETSNLEKSEAIKELNDIFDNLGVERDVDKSGLVKVVGNTIQQTTPPTPTDSPKVEKALENAKKVLDDDEASQSEIDNAMVRLNKSLDEAGGKYKTIDPTKGSAGDGIDIGKLKMDMDNATKELKDDEIYYDKGAPKGAKPYLIEMFEKLESRLSGDVSKGEVDKSITEIQDARDNILSVAAEVGARGNRVKITEEKLKGEELNINELLSDVEDVSLPEVYMQFMLEMNVYNASLSVGSQVIQPTLADFIR